MQLNPDQDQSPKRARALLHPERSRIAVLLHDGPKTAAEIHELLPDIPLGSLYRHLDILIDADFVDAIGKARNRKFAVAYRSNYFTPGDVDSLDGPSMMAMVATLLQIVDQTFSRYSKRAEFPFPDGEAAFVSQSISVTDEEYQALRQHMKEIMSLVDRPATQEMHRRFFAYFSVPDPEPAVEPND